MPQPNLTTERLLLVPLADRHVDLEVELDSDPEVLRFIFGRARTRAEVAFSHTQRMAFGQQVDGLGFWVAYRSNGSDPSAGPPDGERDGQFVGLMMLPPAHGPDQPDDPSVAELGYRISRHHWSQGFASEAARALLRHAFETVGQSRVIAQTMSVNAGSRAVMTKVGLRYVRTYYPEWDELIPGAEAGEVEYEMTQEMWQERR